MLATYEAAKGSIEKSAGVDSPLLRAGGRKGKLFESVIGASRTFVPKTVFELTQWCRTAASCSSDEDPPLQVTKGKVIPSSFLFRPFHTHGDHSLRSNGRSFLEQKIGNEVNPSSFYSGSKWV